MIRLLKAFLIVAAIAVPTIAFAASSTSADGDCCCPLCC